MFTKGKATTRQDRRTNIGWNEDKSMVEWVKENDTYHGHQIEEKKNIGGKSKLTRLAQVSPLVSNGGWPRGVSSPAGSHLEINRHFFSLKFCCNLRSGILPTVS